MHRALNHTGVHVVRRERLAAPGKPIVTQKRCSIILHLKSLSVHPANKGLPSADTSLVDIIIDEALALRRSKSAPKIEEKLAEFGYSHLCV
jgi:hypothetical protein